MLDLDHPVRLSDLLTQWRPDWLSVAVLGVLVVLHARARSRLRAAGQPWARGRDAALVAGVLLGAWVTCGFPQARAPQLMWVWTTQALLLLLVVPLVLVAAQPVALSRSAYGPRSGLVRVLDSRVLRIGGHPVLSLLYVPLTTGLLFFGGVAQLSLRSEPAGWLLHVLLLTLGLVIALPLLDREDTRTSLVVGATLAIGAVELLVDAVPGIVLRLETHLTVPWFARDRPPWSPMWLGDQQTAGSVLWTVAEVLDLPFLVLTWLQWTRVERSEAARVDAELDRRHLAATDVGGGGPSVTTPWWHSDPELRARYGPPPA